GRRPGHDRVLPDRRAFLAHLVRAARAARAREREELRRLVDRVRLAGRRADREGRLMCGAPAQDTGLESVDMARETVIQGKVRRDGAPVPAAYVRLLDSSGEFTAEVVTSATGDFRFFAAPGTWTLRALASGGQGERTVAADTGLNNLQLDLAPA